MSASACCRQLRVEAAENTNFQELSCLGDSRDSQVTHDRPALRNEIPDSAEVSDLGSGTRLTFPPF